MKYKLLKTKAIFEMLLVISLMFIISLSSKEVKAEEKVCCSETTDGNYCQYTNSNNCKEGTQNFPGTCENFANCKPGCCDLTNTQGDYQSRTCYSGVSQGICQKQNGNWLSDTNCNNQQCVKGCCVIGSQTSYTTAAGCSQLTSNYPSLTMDFRKDVISELDCTAIAINMKQGCCVKNNEDGTKNCKSGVGTECIDSGEFYADIFCSDLPQEKCGQCKKHDYFSCVEGTEDVYWFDSCGNREEIVKENDVNDFNRLGIDAFNGNCDYAKGTICGSIVKNEKEQIGCMDVNCKEGIYDDIYNNDDGNGKKRINGESWCQYEGQFAPSITLPGSRSFKHYCFNGKEIAEECKDFREEVCFDSTVQINENQYASAACVSLKTKECGTCKTKNCCESQNKNCLWIKQEPQGIQKLVEDAQKKLKGKGSVTSYNNNQEIGTCIPLVPQGQKFWNNIQEGETTQSSECDFADRTEGTDPKAPIAYWKKHAGTIFTDWDVDWECMGNCQVYGEDYIKGSNTQCGSYGDCGAKYNLAGKWSNKIENFKRECYPEDKLIEGEDGYDLSKTRKDVLSGIKDEGAFEGRDKYYKDYTNCKSDVPNQNNFEEYFNINKNRLNIGVINLDKEFNSGISANTIVGLATYGAFAIFAFVVSFASFAAAGAGTIAASALFGLTFGLAGGASAAGAAGGVFVGSVTGVGSSSAASSATAATAAANVWNPVGWAIAIIAALIVIGSLVLGLLGESYNAQITTDCNTWQPPSGGEFCNLCHEKGINYYGNEVDFTAEGKHECTEYLCRSLGTGCELSITSEGNKCLNLCDASESTKPALIAPGKELKNKLKGMCRTTEEDESEQKDCDIVPLQAQPSGALEIKDPIKANSDINITIQTCQDVNCNSQMYADCRWDKKPVQNFDEATGIFLEIGNAYQHTLQLKANTDILPGQEYTYYVQCRTRCGQPPGTNPFYQIKFKTAKSPDITAPGLIQPLPESPIYLSYEAWNNSNTRAVPIILTFNDRIKECGYSNTNVAFKDMINKIQCPAPSTGHSQTCNIPFMKLKEGENNFYIKCIDKAGNFNIDSLPNNEGIKLIGTLPLKIDSLKCISDDGESCDPIYQNTFKLQVNTIGGIDGTAKCGFGTGRVDVEFLETNSGISTQQIGPLDRGIATKNIYCIDKAGNWNQTSITYNLVKDETAPIITKIYKENDNLVLNTDEGAICKYLTTRIGNYAEATEFEGTGAKEHRNLIGNNDFFNIMCSDRFNNFITINIFVSKSNG